MDDDDVSYLENDIPVHSDVSVNRTSLLSIEGNNVLQVNKVPQFNLPKKVFPLTKTNKVPSISPSPALETDLFDLSCYVPKSSSTPLKSLMNQSVSMPVTTGESSMLTTPVQMVKTTTFPFTEGGNAPEDTRGVPAPHSVPFATVKKVSQLDRPDHWGHFTSRKSLKGKITQSAASSSQASGARGNRSRSQLGQPMTSLRFSNTSASKSLHSSAPSSSDMDNQRHVEHQRLVYSGDGANTPGRGRSSVPGQSITSKSNAQHGGVEKSFRPSWLKSSKAIPLSQPLPEAVRSESSQQPSPGMLGDAIDAFVDVVPTNSPSLYPEATATDGGADVSFGTPSSSFAATFTPYNNHQQNSHHHEQRHFSGAHTHTSCVPPPTPGALLPHAPLQSPPAHAHSSFSYHTHTSPPYKSGPSKKKRFSANSNSLGAKYSKLSRQIEGDESRLFVSLSSNTYDVFDPRNMASCCVDVHVVEAGSVVYPFVRVCVCVDGVHARNGSGAPDSVHRQEECTSSLGHHTMPISSTNAHTSAHGLPLGTTLLAMFKTTCCSDAVAKFATGKCVRLYDPIVIAQSSSRQCIGGYVDSVSQDNSQDNNVMLYCSNILEFID